MSIKHILAAMEAKVGNPSRKLILIKLADNANDAGVCFPSYQHIADHCEVKKRSVIDHISRLEADGFLVKSGRKSRLGSSSNSYQLCISSGGNSEPVPSANSAPPPSANIAPPSANIAPPLVQNLHPEPVTLLTCHLTNNVTNEFATNPEVVASELAKEVLNENPTAKIKPEGWLADIDKAIRLDNRSVEDLLAVIAWIYHGGGGFWKANILSGKKLREKFDQLKIQMNSGGSHGTGSKHYQKSRREHHAEISDHLERQHAEAIAEAVADGSFQPV